MKDIHSSNLHRGRRVLLVVWMLGILPVLFASGALAQSIACGDTLALISPDELTVEFVRDPVLGNNLRWPLLDAAESACYRTSISPELQAKFDPQVSGDYTDSYDRRIEFVSITSAEIGSKDLDNVKLTMSCNHPNTAVPPLPGLINLSNRGGVFIADLPSETAVQSNQGIPAHQPFSDVLALDSWVASDGSSSRIYASVCASVNGLPIVRSDDGGQTWLEPSPDDPVGYPVRRLAVSPDDPDLLFLGTEKGGLFRSDDGGVTIRRADAELTSSAQAVRVVKYLKVNNGQGGQINRLYVSLYGVGFFYSDDNGQSWTEITSLQVPNAQNGVDPLAEPDPDVLPEILDITVSPSNDQVLYVGLRLWGVYKSVDSGQTWERANTDMVLGPPDFRAVNGRNILVFRNQISGEDQLLVSSQFNGIFYSNNGGDTWNDFSHSLPIDSYGTPTTFISLIQDRLNPDVIYGGTPLFGILVSTNRGNNWVSWDGNPEIFTDKLASMIPRPLYDDQFLVGTTGAGIYQPGTPVDLARTIVYSSVPDDFSDANFDIGLQISFSEGTIDSSDNFTVFAQTPQGYAVWRAKELDPVSSEPRWQLIGLYDLTNPEFCFSAPCDELNPPHIAGCFADKKANCFSFEGNTVRFFDREIYVGFTYHYAVSIFDYGYTGETAPMIFAGDMFFSPRSAVESTPESSIFLATADENYNMTTFQVNVTSVSSLDDVIVVPNPLRRQGGWDSGDDSTIRFINVTENSVCEIFTLAGDLVRTLENVEWDNEQKGIIQWDTRNESGDDVASGVYIYRITNDDGGEVVSRFTIIR